MFCQGQSQFTWVFEISHTSPDWSVAALFSSEMQIRSDQWYHQRAAPASCLSVKHASRHICKQLTGPFPAALFLRGLEGWHADADLIVPRLSLNLHVRCQLPCRHHSIAPTLTPNTGHALFKFYLKLGGNSPRAKNPLKFFHLQCWKLQWVRIWVFNVSSCRGKKQTKNFIRLGASCSPCLKYMFGSYSTLFSCLSLTRKDDPETLKTTNFSPKAVMIFSLWNNTGPCDKLFQKVYIFFASGALETQACAV